MRALTLTQPWAGLVAAGVWQGFWTLPTDVEAAVMADPEIDDRGIPF